MKNIHYIINKLSLLIFIYRPKKRKVKMKEVINSSWFRAALAGGTGAALIITGNILYAGIAFGVGVRELLLAFKK